jgi:signal transduction histidine kinase
MDVARGRDCTISSKEDPALATWPDADDVRTLYAAPAFASAGAVEGVLTFVNREQTTDHPFPLFNPRERLAATDAARLLGSSIGFRQTVERRGRLLSHLQAAAQTATTSVVAAMLSHDATRPINTIKKAAEYLERRSDLPNEERTATCREIVGNCDQALGIFRSVVTGRGTSPSSWRVLDIVSQTLRVVLPQIPAGVRLEVSNEIQTPVRVRLWDIVNALTNILTNALEAIESEGLLRISTQKSQDGKKIEIVVHNTGPTVTEDDVKRFFEWGYTEKQGEGRGLGLLIAKDHVEAAGGAISMFSPPEGGVTVVISLPVQNAA